MGPGRFHRRLVLRLALGGSLIAAGLGAAAFWYDLENVDDAIVELAVDEAATLSSHFPDDLDGLDQAARGALDKQFEVFIAQRAAPGRDHFIAADIYDLRRNQVADGSTGEDAKAEALIDQSHHAFPKHGEPSYTKHIIDGRLYLQVMAPLVKSGRTIGWMEGIYGLAPATIRAASHQAVRTAVLVVLSVLASAALLYPVIRGLNRSLLARTVALLKANLYVIEALGNAVAKRDSDTNAHNYRVTLYSVRLAEALDCSSASIRSLIKGAFLHDVGKLAIPDSILLKPAKLTEAEFEIMKTHVAHGLDLVGRFHWLADAAEVVGYHHEKFNGRGYLSGLKGEEIPLNARIFAVADVFDALTSRRPYKEPMSVDDALEIMEEDKGSHFDPRVLDAFTAQAATWHAAYGGREDKGIEDELAAVTGRYFHSEMEG